ncbi:MAG TPA: hypothetical protein VGJ01_13840 [Pseudolabrys sp.]
MTIGLAAGLLAATLSLVAARSQPPQPVAPADLRPIDEILAIASEMGLVPAGKPLRRGPYYVFHAYDRRGLEVRVVADAQLGDILSVVPAGPVALVSPKDRPPRIIDVPQPQSHQDNPAPRRDLGRAEADQHTLLTAPPPSPNSLTPIYPTPRFTEKPETAQTITAAPSGERNLGRQ